MTHLSRLPGLHSWRCSSCASCSQRKWRPQSGCVLCDLAWSLQWSWNQMTGTGRLTSHRWAGPANPSWCCEARLTRRQVDTTHLLTSELTSAIVSLTAAAEFVRPGPGTLGYLECVLLDLILRLARVLILKVDVTLPGARVFLLEAVNDNAACVLHVTLHWGLQVRRWHHLVMNKSLIPTSLQRHCSLPRS